MLEGVVQRRPEKISSLEVDRGLYVLRYTGVVTGDSPVIFVRPSPGSDDLVSVIACPGEPVGRLSEPGSLCVVVVEEDAILQITAQATSVGGSLHAEVRLEPLHHGMVPQSQPIAHAPVAHAPVVPQQAAPARVEPSAPALEMGDFRLMAHVSRRGDVEGEAGEWIGGPEAPAPVEGLVLDCAPHLGSIQYQVMISGSGRWSEWLSAGSFGGSRGRARALTGLRIRFVPASADCSIEGEALFLGSAVIRKDGLELEFRSAAGLDPLVGIRLGLKRTAPTAAAHGVVASATPSGRVRVFKASSVRRSG